MSKRVSVEERRILALRCKIDEQYLYQVLTQRRTASPELCVTIERESDGIFTRTTLRPDDWHRIWPELAEQEKV